MGMLYFTCEKCGRSCGIQAQFIGNLNCENCRNNIEPKGKGVPRFATWHFKCLKCNFRINFESIDCTNVSCVADNQVMEQTEPIAIKKRGNEKRD